MLQFAKEDLNLKIKHLEQLETQDVDFSEDIAKVRCTMDTISDVMKQCVSILEILAQASQRQSQFEANFVQYDPFLHLKSQGNYFINRVNDKQYREKEALIKYYYIHD